MGYCVRLAGQKFRIPTDKVQSCLDELLNRNSSRAETKNIKYFDHLPSSLKLTELVNRVWGFKFTPNETGDIDKVDYELEKMTDFAGFCNSVAAFVDSGSFLEFRGEDGAKWRYLFHDGVWKEVKPIVVWPES